MSFWNPLSWGVKDGRVEQLRTLIGDSLKIVGRNPGLEEIKKLEQDLIASRDIINGWT